MGEVDEARIALGTRLGECRAEIEREILARIGPTLGCAGSGRDPRLSAAVSAGVGQSIAAVECDEDESGAVPEALLAEVQRLARGGVEVDTLLRSCLAAYSLLCDFVLREAESGATPSSADLRRVLRVQAAMFERILATVASEHARERRRRPRPPGARQLECVRSLLIGQAADIADLAYEIGDWHVGAIAVGAGGPSLLRGLARSVDRRLLLVQPEADVAWAWLGGRHRLEAAELVERMASAEPTTLVVLGEPARGQDGWRLTHQQASAALRLAPPKTRGVVRYAEVGLLAAISQDGVLKKSLHQMYLAPLADARDGGMGLRETLRAYFTAGHNVSSAASALGVSRQTVSSRLRVVEEKLGRPLASCATEVEVALRLDLIGAF